MHAMMSSSCLNVPIFGGQGVTSANLDKAREVAIQDSKSQSGGFLLSSCHHAFLQDLGFLNSSEKQSFNLSPNDFNTPHSLLSFSSDSTHGNAIISCTSFFLIQALRYLSVIESHSSSIPSASFDSSLTQNRNRSLGILGFSSGILPACLVGTSSNKLQYVSRAVEAFRLAFWIGFRTEIHRRSVLASLESVDDCSALPWSLFAMGMSREAVIDAIDEFTKKNNECVLNVSSVMNAESLTISGLPNSLAEFSSKMLSSVSVHATNLFALYHSPEHIGKARDDVLSDIRRREIKFPSFSDIITPIRSSETGMLLCSDTPGSLVEAVVDMIMIHPVRWDLVTASLARSVSEGETIRLINIGPGNGLARITELDLGASELVDLTSAQIDMTTNDCPSQIPIAIVGMAVNMPGAPNVEKLWEVLEKGLNMASEIPENRFTVSDYTDHRVSTEGRSMSIHAGNFIDDPDAFDHQFFNISPREARSMDPQQRVLLQTAYESLENAGYVPNATPTFSPETIGCYIGVATNDYVQNLRNDVDIYYSTGTLKSFLSGRISYALQLSGPSIVVDTACSSSLVAIHQACRALANGDCTSALAGGVNIITSPDMYLGLARAHFLSPTGQCKPFDASADGYCRGEGCGVFVLKCLSAAIAENDNILGVIRGVEINHSGLSQSITLPHPSTQAKLLKRLLSRSRISSSRVNVVEAHAAGTQAGDPNELESVRSVLSTGRPSQNPLYVGSVKGNIGHLEAASGAAGLAKLLLMLRHRTIPPSVGFQSLNPKIQSLDFDNTTIITQQMPWNPPSYGHSRIALLNNFGAAGSNVSLLLEEYEYPPQLSSVTVNQQSAVIVGLSAKSEAALSTLIATFSKWLDSSEGQNASLIDIAYTMTARRQIYKHRWACAVSSKKELIEKLHHRVPFPPAPLDSRKVAFVFSGQGSQYDGMGHELYSTNLLFSSTINECHRHLLSSSFPGILHVFQSPHVMTSCRPLVNFEVYQAASFALEYALAILWMSWGISPSIVVGHSLGEYVALVISGVLTMKDALTLVASRAQLMAKSCSTGTTGMLAIGLGSDSVSSILSLYEYSRDISISCRNSFTDTVVSGPIDLLKLLQQRLSSEGRCKTRFLAVPFAYHSSAMKPFAHEFASIARRISIRPPKLPIISNVYGRVILPGDTLSFDAEYFSLHCIEPVQFEQGLSSFTKSPEFLELGAWIEIGPSAPLLPMLRIHPSFANQSTLLLASMREKSDPWLTLSSALARLYTSNVEVSWREVFAHAASKRCLTSLPSYPFSKSKFWVPFAESSPSPAAPHRLPRFTVLHSRVRESLAGPLSQAFIFETPVSLVAHLIRDHKVRGHALCPASLYLELALASISEIDIVSKRSQVVLHDISYLNPLVFNEGSSVALRTCVHIEVKGTGSVKIEQHPCSLHYCLMNFSQVGIQQLTLKFSHLYPTIFGSIESLECSKNVQILSTQSIYDVMFPRVVDYGKQYQVIRTLTISPDGMEAYAVVHINPVQHHGLYVIHPVFMDTLLHAAGFVANIKAAENEAFICSRIFSVEALSSWIDDEISFGVFIRIELGQQETVIRADAFAVDIGSPGSIIAAIQGIEFRKVRVQSLERSLVQAAGVKNPLSPSLVVPSNSSKNTFNAHSTPISQVIHIISSTCGIVCSSITLDTELSYLGVDSLMFIELLANLRSAFPGAFITSSDVLGRRTVMDVVDMVKRKTVEHTKVPQIEHLSTSEDGSALQSIRITKNMVKYQHSTETFNKPPLFLIHDGSGLTSYLSRLSSIGRELWGISNPKIISSLSWESVCAMAAEYSEYVLSSVNDGCEGLMLGGWSFGGVAAFETACQLLKRGIRVRGVLLIDSPSPSHHRTSLPPSLIDYACKRAQGSSSSVGLQLIKNQFEMNSCILSQYEPPKSGPYPQVVLLRSTGTLKPAGVCEGDIPSWLFNRSQRYSMKEDENVIGWARLTGGEVECIDIPGNHFEVFDLENVKQLSNCISEGCNILDDSSIFDPEAYQN